MPVLRLPSLAAPARTVKDRSPASTGQTRTDAYPEAVPGPYDLDRSQLAALLDGEPGYRARQVWEGLHRGRRPEEMTELPAGLRERLAAELPPALRPLGEWTADGGATRKWLWGLEGGAQIETVSMAYPDRRTVCVSTQAGCAMGCRFCATGQGGFTRQLRAGEIVEQVIAAQRDATRRGDDPPRVSHVVFMGMGEPLANYDQVWSAVTRLWGDVGISARHLTISTVGIVPGIRRLASEPLPVNLAVSLHAANDRLRDELVPINRRYPLGMLAEACAAYVAATGRRLSLEWALIDGVNDRRADADELAAFARPLGAHVNLIPLNATPGFPARGTPRPGVRWFHQALQAAGVNATVRRTRGVEVGAACGQLSGGSA